MLLFNCRALLATAALISVFAAEPEGRRDQSDSKLGTFVVVGDSLSAGFQNFSLNDTGQPHGFAAVVASQAGASLPLPLFSYPGTVSSKTPGAGSLESRPYPVVRWSSLICRAA